MESKESVSAEDRETLKAIVVSIAGLLRIVSAIDVHPPPSAYGPYVDAVARKGAAYGLPSEFARVEARLAALKRRIAARPAQAPSALGE